MVDAVVEYNYEAEQPDELSIKPGDIIKNVIMAEGGWWEGELNGKKGMFPDNFVKIIKNPAEVEMRDDTKKKQVQASKRQSVKDLANKIKGSVHEGPPMMRKKAEPGAKKKRAKVVFSYDPENEDELQLSVGDVIDVVKQEEEGWWEGVMNGKQGVFPSNFVEIVEESENSDGGEKSTAPAEEDHHIIKGKKIHGVGLGNIFGDGPIKLRSTTRPAKPDDKPQEPPKTEKRSEESVMRRHKDASANPTNSANPDLMVNPISDYTVVRSDEVFEVVCRDDRHNLNNSGDVRDTERHARFTISPSFIPKEDSSSDTEENVADYTDTNLSYSDFAYVDDDSVDVTNVSEVSHDNSYGDFEVELSNDSSKNAVAHKPALDEEEYSEHLQVILDDLDSCLDQSCSNHNDSEEEIGAVDENDESLLACNVEGRDSESPDTPISAYVGDVCSTPIQSLSFPQAIDSVVVTKKRQSMSRLTYDQATTPASDDSEESDLGIDVSDVSESAVEVPTPLYLPGAIRQQRPSYLSSLNSSGNLSPLMRSIAKKYKLFDHSKPKFKDNDVELDVEPDDLDTSYGSIMMGHSPDVQIPTMEDAGDYRKVPGEQNDANDMVRNYVYDVLAGSTNEKDSTASFETGLAESDLDKDRTESRQEDGESMMVCVDEYSVRFMDIESKDTLVTDQDDRTEDDSDSVSSEGGILLCMTEGNDSSPPLSCCSASFYPRLDQSLPCPDTLRENYKPKLTSDRAVRSVYDSPDSFPGFKAFSLQSDLKLPDSGPIRATSSYCRIPFNNDAPSFWFKKDFNESPCRTQNVHSPSKFRSPKRTINEISQSFPSLFALAEKVYLQEFKWKLEAFKTEHIQVLLEGKSPCFFRDRSPARKKRRRVPFSPQLALNVNANALTGPYNECIQIDPEAPGSVDAYFAEKIDSPTEIVQKVVPSLAQTDLQTLSCCLGTEAPRIDWSESLFSKKSFRRKSRNTKHIQVKHVEPQPDFSDRKYDADLETNNKENKTSNSVVSNIQSSSRSDSTDDSMDNLIDDCTEKRRKRRFTPRSKSELQVNPVQLISFKKLPDTSSLPLLNSRSEYATASRANSTSSVKTSKTLSVVDLILKQDSSIFASSTHLKISPEPFSTHKVQDIMYQVANEDTNAVLSYFDHGDEPIVDIKQQSVNKIKETEPHNIDTTISTLQEAVEQHVDTANRETGSVAQVIRMLGTRGKLYEAISEAVSFCAEEIDKELELQDAVIHSGNQLDETQDSVTRPEKSYDLTPDTEALEEDLNAIDLSGTPVYANTEGEDNKMKAFLNDAMESFDNILIDSFASSTEISENDESSDRHESDQNLLDDTEGSESMSDTGEVDFVEIDDDSVLVVLGKPCMLHNGEEIDHAKGENVICPGQADETVEIEDDSILNVIGKKCFIYIQDNVEDVPTLKDLCYKSVQHSAKHSTTTLRFRDVTNCDYDEVFEVDEMNDNEEQKSPDCPEEEIYGSYPCGARRPGNLYSPIPGFFCTHSTIDRGLEIGIPDYESSPLLKMASDKGNIGYYNTEEVLLDEEELMFPEDPTESMIINQEDIKLTIHTNSPVDFVDLTAEKTGEGLQDMTGSACNGNLYRMLEVIEELTEEGDGIDTSDDSRWMEEHVTASTNCTPAKDDRDLIMSECPSEFEEKLSSYPSPKI